MILTILSLILAVIKWGIIPLIIISIFASCAFIAWQENHDKNVLSSKRFAFWAGLLAFVLIVTTSQFTTYLTPPVDLNAFKQPWLYVLAGLFFGMVVIGYVVKFFGKRAISMMIMLMTGASLSALYYYIFIDVSRDAILLLALSFMFGSMLYFVLFPVPDIRSLWKK